MMKRLRFWYSLIVLLNNGYCMKHWILTSRCTCAEEKAIAKELKLERMAVRAKEWYA